MKKYIFGFIIFILFYSCSVSRKSRKQNNPENEIGVFVTCSGSDFLTSKKYFRANSIGESIDQVVSKRKALNNAKADLAASVKILMESVIDNYVKSSELNN